MKNMEISENAAEVEKGRGDSTLHNEGIFSPEDRSMAMP
jgi:hypothetical protein